MMPREARRMTAAEFAQLRALELFLLRGRFDGVPPERLGDLRGEYRRLMALWFACSPDERRILQMEVSDGQG